MHYPYSYIECLKHIVTTFTADNYTLYGALLLLLIFLTVITILSIAISRLKKRLKGSHSQSFNTSIFGINDFLVFKGASVVADMKSPMINNFMKEPHQSSAPFLKSLVKEYSTSMDTERGPFNLSVQDVIDFDKLSF